MSPTCKDAVSLSLGQNSAQTRLEIKKKIIKKNKKKKGESKGHKGSSWYFIRSQYLLPTEDVMSINLTFVL